jgi:hypothetical protein
MQRGNPELKVVFLSITLAILASTTVLFMESGRGTPGSQPSPAARGPFPGRGSSGIAGRPMPFTGKPLSLPSKRPVEIPFAYTVDPQVIL